MSHCSYAPNHCVQIVGVNVDEGYYKIRNSWSEAWGEGGYIYLRTNENMCGVKNGTPQYTKVKQG